jgi:hypothetical protein
MLRFWLFRCTHLYNVKYTLDSDEERDDLNGKSNEINVCCFLEKYDLEIGQERATIGFDDDIKITPFNIDEEMTDLADQFVFNGQIDISRETYEQLKNKT